MSILVNSSPMDEFCLERGIRQGDPLSPFLLILAAEGLNAIVNEAVETGVFTGVKVGKDNVCFEEVSGLRVNYNNNSKLYGMGVNKEDVREMARWMKCDVGEFPFTYLGLLIGLDMKRVERAFNIDRRKEGTVAKKRKWVDGVWRWDWDWVRNIRRRVCKEFEYLQNLLQNVVIMCDCRDRWRWALHYSGDFTVKELTKMVEENILNVDIGGDETIWNKLVRIKVNIFVWRDLKGRLPVREELDKRGIDLDLLLCPSCGDMVESCSHCLVMCNFAMSVWEKNI
ncbi:reverse transcriptase domain, reverse transcriptase zinc-binding domain protein [Tanacetum coccineum]